MPPCARRIRRVGLGAAIHGGGAAARRRLGDAPDATEPLEPTNGLDADGARTVVELVAQRRAEGKATLLTTNDPALAAALGGQTYRLGAGRLVADGAAGAAGVFLAGGAPEGERDR